MLECYKTMDFFIKCTVAHGLLSILIDTLIIDYKFKCIKAAEFAKRNKDYKPFYETSILYAKIHFEKFNFLKERKQQFIKECT